MAGGILKKLFERGLELKVNGFDWCGLNRTSFFDKNQKRIPKAFFHFLFLHNVFFHTKHGTCQDFTFSKWLNYENIKSKYFTMELKDKFTIITGGGGGIGPATAKLFLNGGGSLIITSSCRTSRFCPAQCLCREQTCNDRIDENGCS